MSENYQTKTAPVVTAAEVAVRDRVTIEMTELAGDVAEACWPWRWRPGGRSCTRS